MRNRTTITIKGIPIVMKEDNVLTCFLLDGVAVDRYFLKPIYSYLPITEEGNMLQGDSALSAIPEGLYLTGMAVISDCEICPGFTNALFDEFGLIIKDARPMQGMGDRTYDNSCLIYLRFGHVYTNHDIQINR